MATKSTKTVRMVGRISGSRDGKDWPAPGQTIELPEDEANALLLNGMAVSPDAEETATATTSGVETATARGNQPLRVTAAKAEADAQDAAAKLLEGQAKKTDDEADAEAKAAAKK